MVAAYYQQGRGKDTWGDDDNCHVRIGLTRSVFMSELSLINFLRGYG